jgi:hypothetical protein
MFRKHNASVPAHPEIVAEMETWADLVVAGIGD